MLHFHIAFTLALLALVAGTWLFIWAKHTHTAGGCCWLGKIVGLFVMIVSLIMVICSIVCGVMAWHHAGGYMTMPAQLQQAMSMSDKGVSDVGSPGTPATYHKR